MLIMLQEWVDAHQCSIQLFFTKAGCQPGLLRSQTRRDPLLSGRPTAFFRQVKRAPPLFLCSLLREPHLHSLLLWVCDEEEEANRN
jgi:hypothetical protein